MMCRNERAAADTISTPSPGIVVLVVAMLLALGLGPVPTPGTSAEPMSTDGAPSSSTDEASAESHAELEARIAKLIAQLGAEEFAVREKAQRELGRIGVAAFDALHAAQSNEDIEIALRARYLVRSMNVLWAHDDDPAEIKRILRSYGSQSDEERRSRMARLAGMEGVPAVAALVRIARFESSDVLSKEAGILVLRAAVPADDPDGENLAEAILASLGPSKRSAAEWLRTYARTLRDPESSLAEWDRLTRAEHDVYTQFPEKSGRQIVRDLMRWQVDLLRRLDYDDQAGAVIARCMQLLDGTRDELFEAAEWYMERHYWQPIEQLSERFPDTFAGDPLLLYRLAEAQLQLGKMEQAEETAQRAMNNVPDGTTEHTLMAFRLAERGMFSWAQREYRHVMELAEAGSPDDIRARLLLSELLHDLEEELEAAKVLEPVVEAFDKNPSAVQFVQQVFRREPGSVKSRMHYFYAASHARAGDTQKQREALDQAVASDPTDADVLIAMYRLPGADAEWRERTHKQIDAAVGHFRDQVNAFHLQAEHAPNEQVKAYWEQQLAAAHNQLAWLVGNTEGDFDEAVRSSRTSLEIRPEAGGYYDTLARCYYAKGDFENAVESQRKAVELEPHSGQIKRQLELFEKALAESGEKAP